MTNGRMNNGMTLELDERDYRNVMTSLGRLSKIDQNSATRRAIMEGVKYLNKFVRKAVRGPIRNKIEHPYTKHSGQGGKIYRVTRNLQKSIMTSYRRKRVGATGYAAHKGTLGHHAHLLEFGTKERYYVKNGKRHNTGSVNPYLYKSNILKSHGTDVMTKVLDVVVAQIEKLTNF